MKPSVFIPEPISASGMYLLEPALEIIAPWTDGGEWSAEESGSTLRASDAVIVRLFRVGREDLENSPRLQVIGKHGVGVDNIDVQAAAQLGIPVVHTPTANSNAVAEHTLALMMALSRRIEPASQAVKQGRFAERDHFQGVELAGKTLGVVGLGRVGRRVAEMAVRGLGMVVVGYDPLILLTPHISSSTKESLVRMARGAAQGVIDVLEGKIPEFVYRLENQRR